MLLNLELEVELQLFLNNLEALIFNNEKLLPYHSIALKLPVVIHNHKNKLLILTV